MLHPACCIYRWQQLNHLGLFDGTLPNAIPE
jgi:hypothetical protein